MALVTADRVREFTSTNGTGTLTLTGAAVGYQTFSSAIGNGNTCYYAVYNPGINEWEVGIGTVGAGTLARTTVLSSSNSDALVPFSAGTKDVFVTYPAEAAVFSGGTPSFTSVTAGSVSSGQVDITAQGDLRLQDSAGGEYVALQAPSVLAASYTLTLPIDDGTNGQALITDGSGNLSWSTAASGDVYGPASATDNAVARFDGTTGKLIQNSAVTIGDDGATVIAANSSSDGLRITQTGTGNALVVEDSANPDSTPFVVANDGRTIVGASIGYSGVFNQAFLQAHAVGGNGAIDAFRYTADTFGADLGFNKSRSATTGTQTIVASGDTIGALRFNGSDGTAFIQAASIVAAVDGTPGTNDMPGRLVFSTTADGASSPTERMRIDNAGGVGIGGTSPSGRKLYVTGSATGATATGGILTSQTIQSDATSYRAYRSSQTTAASAFTLGELSHFFAEQTTFGAGSTVTNQYGFFVQSNLTGATNNYGFYSNIAVDTGRWNFYANGTAANYFAGTISIGTTSTDAALRIQGSTTINSQTNVAARIGANVTSDLLLGSTNGNTPFVASQGAYPLTFFTDATERMRIDSAGRVGIAAGTAAGYNINIGQAITGATTTYALINQGSIKSDVTSEANIFTSALTTQAASFSISRIRHFFAYVTSVGAGSTVTNQYGFLAESTLTGATNNYGFYSNIASGTGRYNFYAAGSAPNYFAGAVTIVGALTVTDPVVQQSDIGTAPNEVPVNGYLGDLAFQNKEGFVITPAASATPNGIGDMTFELTNNTTLVVKVKGSDGTVRSATLTLA